MTVFVECVRLDLENHSYDNVSFDPCEFTLHTAANAENNDCSKKNLYAFCNT